ncbi:MAG: hypothetical protein KatS3mg111_4105 [Pirellulaceae bacterium]|nr:MAG: hypothetical protein KatS3mg111_4105 [Pirellulaceae bacterium]
MSKPQKGYEPWRSGSPGMLRRFARRHQRQERTRAGQRILGTIFTVSLFAVGVYFTLTIGGGNNQDPAGAAPNYGNVGTTDEQCAPCHATDGDVENHSQELVESDAPRGLTVVEDGL